jgi:DNA-binding response OmpR family regulator
MQTTIGHSRATAPRVLLVDDDAGNRTLLYVGLRLAGIDAIEAENGWQGLERALAEEPNLVVLDVKVAGLDGFELATKLREDARTSSIPVLFVSAEADESHELRARALGALGYLTKPFDPSAVVSLIGRALGGTDARQTASTR